MFSAFTSNLGDFVLGRFLISMIDLACETPS